MIPLALFLAEIGDKEPSLPLLWSIAFALSVASFCSARRRGWSFVIILALAAIWVAAVAQELRDPFIRSAMIHELGRSYLVQTWAALLLPFIVAAIGLLTPTAGRFANRSTRGVKTRVFEP